MTVQSGSRSIINNKATQCERSSGRGANRSGEADELIGRRRRRQTRRNALAILGVGLVLTASIVGAGVLAGLRVNLTPSEPLGLWRAVPLDRPVVVGDLVIVCPPSGAVSEFGLARGYLRRGTCPGGAAPLIKTVAATVGATIVVGTEVVIDGTLLPNSRLSPKDGQGRVLAPWVGGPVLPGLLFLHSSFRGSYDSRYFGPVPDTGLLGFAQPVFTFFLTGTNAN